MLTVSVVIPIRNAAKTLTACLDALLRLHPAPQEIVLVDNGSTDFSPSIMTEFQARHAMYGIRIIEEPRRGASAARNTGIRNAKGEVIAFTDADCTPAPDWIEKLMCPFEDADVGAVAGNVAGVSGQSMIELFSALYTLQSSDQPASHREWTPWSGGYPTANFAVRRDLLEALQGFDECVTLYGEDYDLCARLYAQGTSIVYRPDAVVSHHHRTTLRGLLRQAFGFGRSHAYLVRRHLKRGLWVELPRRSMVWKNFPLRGWVDIASADKKVLAILALGALYRPFLLLLPLFVLWVAVEADDRAMRKGTAASPPRCLGLASLLVLKSAAMTVGRWWGSVKYGALCL